MSGPTAKPARREIELDFIRGIAILMVLEFHSPHDLQNGLLHFLGGHTFGWAGVDVFFVLSGFLVGGLLIKEWLTRQSIVASRFLVRRGFKIWPQYYVFLLVNLVSGHRSLHSLWGNLLNIQNYTGGIAHTWSLAVEEHVYLLLAALLPLAARFRMSMRTLLSTVGITCILTLCWREYLSSHVNVFTRTDTRMDGILYGLLLAILYHAEPQVFRQLQQLRWLWIAIVLFIVAYLGIAPGRLVPANLGMFVADMGGVALLLLLYRHQPAVKRSWTYRLVAWIGLYSYGIYLWHVGIVGAVERVTQHLHGATAAICAYVVPPLAGILCGVLTSKLIEFPALKLRDRLFPRRVDAATGPPAIIEQQTGIRIPAESTSAPNP